jgi:hypothetical protein
MFELEVRSGKIFKVFKGNNEKTMIAYNGVNYNLESLIYLLEEKKNSIYSVSEAEIQQFESNPKIRKVMEESEQDLEQARVLSTKDVIDKIRKGEI